MDQVQLRPVLAFVMLSFGLAWLLSLPLWLGKGLEDRLFVFVAIAMMWTPALAAFVVGRCSHPDVRVATGFGLAAWRPLRRTVWFSLCAALSSLAISLIALAIGAAWGVYHFDLTDFKGFHAMLLAKLGGDEAALSRLPPLGLLAVISVLQVIPAAPINAVVALGEEIGWRGWLLPRLMPLGLLPAVILSGIIWALWHAPLILLGYNYGATPGAVALLCMTASCMVLGSVLAWFRLRSGSIWPAAVGHGAVNAAAGLPLVLSAAGHTIDPTQATVLGWTGWIFPALLAWGLFQFMPVKDGAAQTL